MSKCNTCALNKNKTHGGLGYCMIGECINGSQWTPMQSAQDGRCCNNCNWRDYPILGCAECDEGNNFENWEPGK